MMGYNLLIAQSPCPRKGLDAKYVAIVPRDTSNNDANNRGDL